MRSQFAGRLFEVWLLSWKKRGVGLYVSNYANDSPHENYISDSKVMIAVAVSKLDWIVSIPIVRVWLEMGKLVIGGRCSAR